jgi:flagellar biosynthetic protein FliP
MKALRYHGIQCLLVLALWTATSAPALRAEDAAPGGNSTPLEIKVGEDGPKISATFSVLIGMTLLAVLPSILIMTTSFMRIIIVLGFLRSALSTQQSPPNIVLVGIALFLTLFIMGPVFNRMNQDAVAPYSKGEINQTQAFERGIKPLREFMGKQTRKKDLALMIDLSRAQTPREFNDVPTLTLIPAFMLSELRTAFQMGFLLFLPFLVIDLVVSATLMSLGMMMLPPSTFSLPLKLLLFVLADGWELVVKSLVVSFGM